MSKINSNEFYADFDSLAALKNQAQKDPQAALKRVAQEFESIFIGMLLKNMRSANETIGGTDLFSSSQTRQYEEMLDSQMAQSMARSGGVGLAEALVRQFQGKGTSVGGGDDLKGDGALLNTLATQELARMQLFARETRQKVLSTPTLNPVVASPEVSVPVEKVIFDSPEDFVEKLWPLAQQTGATLGVDPKAILAQAALETGWGKYPIAKEDGSASFNMFGIKADSRWQGERAVVTTLEYENGIAKKQQAPFRAYRSFADSFADYAQFLQTSTRYQDALQNGDNAPLFASKLQQGGYATDPNYSQKIQSILSTKWFSALL